jgi:hypothetical protein
MQFFGCEQRKSVFERKPQLMSKNRQRTGSCAIMFLHTIVEDVFHQIEVLAHWRSRDGSTRKMGKFTPCGNCPPTLINAPDIGIDVTFRLELDMVGCTLGDTAWSLTTF